MPSCAIATRKNTQRNQKKNKFVFHKFPKMLSLAKIWIGTCKRKDNFNWKNAYIFSDHFDESQYEVDKVHRVLGLQERKFLKADAKPTTHLPLKTENPLMEFKEKTEEGKSTNNKSLINYRVQGFFESSKKQTAAGTLCELLQIQLRDSTFTFPPKLQQASYCLQCVQKLREAHRMINNLRELEKQIQDVRKEVKNKLKESCEKRRSIGNGDNSDDDSHSEDEEDSFHPFDQFREDVVKESHPLVSSTSSTEMKLNRKTPTCIKKVVLESSKALKRKLPEFNSNSSINTRSIYTRSSQEKSNLEKTFSENMNINVPAISSEKITIDNVDNSVPKDISHNYENPHKLDLEDDLSTAFISIMSEADAEDSNQESQEFGSDVEDNDNLEDTEEIYVDATSDGRFQCPYAPVCEETFLPADKSSFLNHVRLSHEGKFPKTTEKLPNVKMQKLFTCKFCEKSYASTKLLKDHHIQQHDDEEWFPGHEVVKKKRIIPNRSVQSGKLVSVAAASRKVKDADSKERPYKCTNCDAMFTRAYHLEEHSRIHTGVTPFKCKECPEAFRYAKSLRSHLLKVHGEGDYFECHLCKRKYVFQNQLTKHLRRHHELTTV